MTKKTIYIAFDGKQFDDEDKCVEYESLAKAKEIGDDLLLYDKNGNRIKTINYASADKIDYIIVKSEKAYDYLEEKMDNYGLDYPSFSSKLPIYSYYSYDKNEWCDIKDKIEDLQEELDRLNKYLIK